MPGGTTSARERETNHTASGTGAKLTLVPHGEEPTGVDHLQIQPARWDQFKTRNIAKLADSRAFEIFTKALAVTKFDDDMWAPKASNDNVNNWIGPDQEDAYKDLVGENDIQHGVGGLWWAIALHGSTYAISAFLFVNEWALSTEIADDKGYGVYIKCWKPDWRNDEGPLVVFDVYLDVSILREAVIDARFLCGVGNRVKSRLDAIAFTFNGSLYGLLGRNKPAPCVTLMGFDLRSGEALRPAITGETSRYIDGKSVRCEPETFLKDYQERLAIFSDQDGIVKLSLCIKANHPPGSDTKTAIDDLSGKIDKLEISLFVVYITIIDELFSQWESEHTVDESLGESEGKTADVRADFSDSGAQKPGEPLPTPTEPPVALLDALTEARAGKPGRGRPRKAGGMGLRLTIDFDEADSEAIKKLHAESEKGATRPDIVRRLVKIGIKSML